MNTRCLIVSMACGAGIVLSGGASLLEGAAELAERITGMPVKIGEPIAGGGLVETIKSPMYATGVGLIYYALQGNTTKRTERGTGIAWILKRFREMVDNLFG